MSNISIDPEKEKHILELVKSLREIDACIEPYQEQRKDLRNSYIEEGRLTKEEYNYVKKAYNALKRGVDMDDLSTFVDIARKEMPHCVEE